MCIHHCPPPGGDSYNKAERVAGSRGLEKAKTGGAARRELWGLRCCTAHPKNLARVPGGSLRETCPRGCVPAPTCAPKPPSPKGKRRGLLKTQRSLLRSGAHGNRVKRKGGRRTLKLALRKQRPGTAARRQRPPPGRQRERSPPGARPLCALPGHAGQEHDQLNRKEGLPPETGSGNTCSLRRPKGPSLLPQNAAEHLRRLRI